MEIKIPEFCLVAMVGTSGSGKSTFASKHFLPSEVVSSDYCRALVSDDETSQDATGDAFDVLNYITQKRLSRGKLTVIDATNVQEDARRSIIKMAKDNDCFAAAIVLNLPERLCQDRNAERSDRDFGPHVIRRQKQQLRKSISKLRREGFRYVYVMDDQETIDKAEVNRTKLWTDRRDEHGPFDIIGDIHGCFDELLSLLSKLDYKISGSDMETRVIAPPGRRVIFLGDLVDRGPKSPEVLNLVMNMVESGDAICVPGNHDVKLMKKLKGRNVKIAYGLAETLEQLESHSEEFKEKVAGFIDSLVSHFVLDRGNLVVSHAGMKARYQGRSSGRVREFALYGDTTGETDEYGLPVRYEWANDYRGDAMVVYGHTPVGEAQWTNRTINIDTGCVFGGQLTALRYPEREIVSVEALKEYYDSIKPFKIEDNGNGQSVHQDRDYDILDIEDVSGKRRIQTPYRNTITIREENAAAALETMSRFAVDPHWLIYLPPTMSPCETSNVEDYLERPEEAFAYYSSNNVFDIVCQEKHMGSRAIVIACSSEEAARKRFGITDNTTGVCYTRTGRRFFNDIELEQQFLTRVRKGLEEASFWQRFDSDWVALDCELMPWSSKARELLKDQYAHTGAAANASLESAIKALEKAHLRGIDQGDNLDLFREKKVHTDKYIEAYRQYCWPVNGIDDYKLAPFHILASEGKCHTDKDHIWHMDEIKKLTVGSEGLIIETAWLKLDTSREEEIKKGVEWWQSLTDKGGEGMVVKPLNFISKEKGKILQPAVKCRGREYLRIIYGPEYNRQENIDRLRKRGLSTKRSLAIREFALGMASLEHFVNQEPLYKVHECVFAVLAMESEPVDPRL